jgi:hypothetical protein
MGIVRIDVLLQGSDLEAQRRSVNARFRGACVLSGTLQTPPPPRAELLTSSEGKERSSFDTLYPQV